MSRLVEQVYRLDQVLTWSKDREYRGYSKHDALNSIRVMVDIQMRVNAGR